MKTCRISYLDNFLLKKTNSKPVRREFVSNINNDVKSELRLKFRLNS